MKRLTITMFLAGLVSAPAVSAQEAGETTRPVIVVQGRGVAERAPDAFFIGGDIRGEGRDSVEALRALTAAQARITEGLSDMEGLTGGTLRTEGVSVEPQFAADCRPDRRDSDACPVSGYSARMRFQFKGSPASSAGNAVSLAAEMGARNVSTTGAEVEDETALRAEASRLAFADAQRQADTLAQASGRRIVRVLRVQDSNARVAELKSGEIGEIVVTGSRIRPTVAVAVDQPPIEIESRLTVVFEID